MSNLPGIIERIAIVVDDLSSTIEFYRNYLGFALEKQYCNQELGIRAAVLVRRTSRIELFEYSSDEEFGLKISSSKKRILRNRSIEKGIRKITFRSGPLQKARVKSKNIPKAKKMSANRVFQDPNGFILEEISEKKSPRPKSLKNKN